MFSNGFKKIYSQPLNPAGNYLFKVNNRNTIARCEICSKLTIKIPAYVNFEHISHLVLVFLLLPLSRQLPAGNIISKLVSEVSLRLGYLRRSETCMIFFSKLINSFQQSTFFSQKATVLNTSLGYIIISEAYLKPCQTCKMERFAKIVNGFYCLIRCGVQNFCF